MNGTKTTKLHRPCAENLEQSEEDEQLFSLTQTPAALLFQKTDISSGMLQSCVKRCRRLWGRGSYWEQKPNESLSSFRGLNYPAAPFFWPADLFQRFTKGVNDPWPLWEEGRPGGGGRRREDGGGWRYLCSDLILRPVTANKLTDRRFSLKPGPADPQPPLAPTQHSAEGELWNKPCSLSGGCAVGTSWSLFVRDAGGNVLVPVWISVVREQTMCAWFPVCLWHVVFWRCSFPSPATSSLCFLFSHFFLSSSLHLLFFHLMSYFGLFPLIFFSPSLSSRLPLCAYLHRGPWEICAPLSVFQFSGVIPDKICSIRNVTWCSAGRWAPADNRDELCGFSHKSPVKLRRSD